MTKKELILKTAMKLFIENGYENTPTSRISKEAGVATGTLFHHFKTKEDIFLGVYTSIKLEMLKKFNNFVNDGRDLELFLKDIFITYIEWAAGNPMYHKFMTMFKCSPHLCHITDERIIESMVNFNDLLTKGVEDKIIKDVPVDIIKLTIYNLGQAFVDYFVENPEKLKDKELKSKIYSIFWDAIKR